MAEQEACASAVTEALAAAGEAAEGGEGSDTRGESLLLPLLQGLLGGGGQRLLAGLGAAPADVVADVRRSLERLRAALAPPARHPQARALLALADRLDDALDAAARLDGCRRRPRRRRATRHTVGVSRDELAAARRLVDRDQLALGADADAEPPPDDAEPSPERERDGAAPAPIAPVVSADNVVVEKRAPGTRKPDFYRHSIAETGGYSQHNHQPARRPQPPLQPIHQPQPVDLPQQIYQPPHQQPGHPQQTYQPSLLLHRNPPQQMYQPQKLPQNPPQPMYQPQKLPQNPPQPTYQPQPLQQNSRTERRPSDTRSSIATLANKFDSCARADKENAPRRAPADPPHRKDDPQRAPLYRPLPPTYNFAAPPSPQDDSKPLNRFGNNKRLRMKRANTIDIGRPLAGYKLDSDTDDDPAPGRAPPVPEFRPQTENDRKFVAFMKKTEAAEREAGAGPANWSSRFGNIKNAFEGREREDNSRSSSASSARRFWRSGEQAPARPRAPPAPPAADAVKPPWLLERREPARGFLPRQAPQQPPAPLPGRVLTPQSAPAATSAAPPFAHPAAPAAIGPPQPPVPRSPTKPLVVKPFVTRPIPVNQFSHAPMSAFKPLAKMSSPTSAPAHVWSPPSLSGAASPAADAPHGFLFGSKPTPMSPPAPRLPWAVTGDEHSRALGVAAAEFESAGLDPPPGARPAAFAHPPSPPPPPPPTHALPLARHPPARLIPGQDELAAPGLVLRAEDPGRPAPDLPAVDAQRLQIEFYERQIREKNRREPMTNGHAEPTERKPPPPAYTVTDYTPAGPGSTFVPLQRTPDIEKARAHKVDYLPDVVTNDAERGGGGGGGAATEHGSVVTRVMRGPVRGAATITAGVRTRSGARDPAADSLRGALDKLAAPRRDAIAQLERTRRAPASDERSPPSPFRESASSSSVASPGSSPLSRSGSWQRAPQSASPRRVVARASSMNLLAVPKLYEGGIAREEVSEKKRTMEAYFSERQATSPRRRPLRQAQAQAQAYSLGRSRTMPTVAELQFLDESNTDDAFEDLVSALA